MTAYTNLLYNTKFLNKYRILRKFLCVTLNLNVGPHSTTKLPNASLKTKNTYRNLVANLKVQILHYFQKPKNTQKLSKRRMLLLTGYWGPSNYLKAGVHKGGTFLFFASRSAPLNYEVVDFAIFTLTNDKNSEILVK